MAIKHSNQYSFTLIELLIVVAIIGILAAIAVPNFLNAQTRAKLARVQSDFKNISTALESYMIDNNSYPEDAWRGLLIRPNGWIMLSTPISYIETAGLVDPFKAPFIEVADMDRQFGDALYEVGTGNSTQGQNGYNDYMINSLGPDSNLGADEADDSNTMASYPFSSRLLSFDASNGLISDGDIYRFRGGTQPARTVAVFNNKPWSN